MEEEGGWVWEGGSPKDAFFVSGAQIQLMTSPASMKLAAMSIMGCIPKFVYPRGSKKVPSAAPSLLKEQAIPTALARMAVGNSSLG